MDRSPRAETLRLMRCEEEISPPPLPDLEKDSPEALDFLSGIKEAHYVSLAKTINALFEQTVEQRTKEAPYGLSNSQAPYIEVSGWRKLAEDFRATFIANIDSIKNTDEYKKAEQYTTLIGRLDGNRWINLRWQLDGGVGTGVTSTLTLLRNAPNIVKAHDPDSSTTEVSKILRHPRSLVLLRKLANVSINQMMAAQSVLAGEVTEHNWSNEKINAVLDPEHFKLQQDTKGHKSLAYVDFKALSVPKGYRPRHSGSTLEKTTLVKDIAGHQPKTIGCPITLLNGRLAELLDWGIDIVEGENLWEESWPLPGLAWNEEWVARLKSPQYG